MAFHKTSRMATSKYTPCLIRGPQHMKLAWEEITHFINVLRWPEEHCFHSARNGSVILDKQNQRASTHQDLTCREYRCCAVSYTIYLLFGLSSINTLHKTTYHRISSKQFSFSFVCSKQSIWEVFTATCAIKGIVIFSKTPSTVSVTQTV